MLYSSGAGPRLEQSLNPIRARASAFNWHCARFQRPFGAMVAALYTDILRIIGAKPRRLMASRFSAEDISVARVLSQAPPGLKLNYDLAKRLLRRNVGSVSGAVRAARRQARNDPAVLQPVPELGETFYNLGHAANSCYIAATLVACFAEWDAWDPLLSPTTERRTQKVERLRTATRSIVNTMRTGGTVSVQSVEEFRKAVGLLGFAGGSRQEDPTELYLLVMDALGAPKLPFNVNLIHQATPIDSDARFELESIIPLSIADSDSSGDNGPIHFEKLLYRYFFDNQLEGLVRPMIKKEQVVNAWGIRLLLPEKLRHSSFASVALPFCIKRYIATREKDRTPVYLPVTMDFTAFVDAVREGGKYVLRLKSVVCHLGQTIDSGHYVTYTYDQTGWRRWNDLSKGEVETSAEDMDELPVNDMWRREIQNDSYIVFYELLPGDGTLHPGDLLEDSGVGLWTNENSEFAGELNEMLRSTDALDSYLGEVKQVQSNMEYAAIMQDEQIARETQSLFDADLARRAQCEADAAYARSENTRLYLAREQQARYDPNYAEYYDAVADEGAPPEDLPPRKATALDDDTNAFANVHKTDGSAPGQCDKCSSREVTTSENGTISFVDFGKTEKSASPHREDNSIEMETSQVELGENGNSSTREHEDGDFKEVTTSANGSVTFVNFRNRKQKSYSSNHANDHKPRS